VIGRIYLEHGSPVVVLIRWGRTTADPDAPIGKLDGSDWGQRRAPHNVLIERQDGSRVILPFRGLRKLAPADALDIAAVEVCHG
jgi:acetyl esterase